MNYSEIFTTTAAFAGAIVFLTEWLKTIFKISGNAGIYLAWGVGIVLAIIGNLFNLGLFVELDWIAAIVFGFLSGLSANGLFDTGFVDWIVSLFKTKT